MKVFKSRFAIFCFSFLFLILLAPISRVSAATNVNGDISTDTAWSLAGSPYLVTTPITVIEGVTLTINPGVVVNGQGVSVLGHLVANGNTAHPVTFNNSYLDLFNANNDSSLSFINFSSGSNFLSHSSALSVSNLNFSNSGGLQLYSGSSLGVSHLVFNNILGDAIGLYGSSHLVADSINMDTVGGNAIGLYGGSIATISDASINNIAHDAIGLYQGSSLILDNSSISHVINGDGVGIYQNSIFSADHLTLQHGTRGSIGSQGIGVYQHSTLTLTHSTISDFSAAGIVAYNDEEQGPPTVTVSDTTLTQNQTGLAMYSNSSLNTVPTLSFANNFIYANTGYGAQVYWSSPLNLENNWWGDSTGPYNATTNPTGLGDTINNDGGPIPDFTPWLTTGPLPQTPAHYYAKITGFSPFTNLRETPSASGVLVKTLPNDWIVYIVAKTDTNGQPVVADGFRWYQVQDPTDNTTMWMIAGSPSGAATRLPYDSTKQTEYQNTSATHIDGNGNNQKNARKQSILDSVHNYFTNTNTTKSLYNADDHALNISTLSQASFPEELSLAILAQEDGPNFNNESVSFDYGHGISQVTFDAHKNEAPGHTFLNNANDPRGILSDVTLSKCDEIGSANYKKCYQHTDTYNSQAKPYDNYNHINSNPLYKQYANTVQSIYANIKDGLGILRSKYGHVYQNPCTGSVIVGGLTFSCTDLRNIKAVWGYNGATLDPSVQYLKSISQKLGALATYFSNHSYNDADQLIEKLAVANDHRKEIKVLSPVQLSVTDSLGNVTGVINTQEIDAIPNSYYDADSESVLLLFPNDTYTYKVVGDGSGSSYGFGMSSANGGDSQVVFQATDIPITDGEIHTYHVDETVLAQGGQGVTVDIDTNGDGTPERTVTTGATLTDITAPVVDLTQIATEQSLGEKINLKDITTDNVSTPNHLTFSATWDGAVLAVTNKNITLPAIGTHTLGITATDEVGNSATYTKQVHVSFIFLGFKPNNFNGGTFHKNQPLTVKFRIKAKNGLLIPLQYPALSVVRVSDGYHAVVNPNYAGEDPDCDTGDECFQNHHNRYKKILPANLLTVGQWVITTGFADGTSYSATVNIIN